MTIEICICARTELVEPKGESTQQDIDLFLQDNKHVAGGILHNGTAYLKLTQLKQGDSCRQRFKHCDIKSL
ncbi:hypothetical protein AKG98_1427 [Moritella sp. JT01]|uniref:hypothetical protein n=1 Tax=Moritella sp. JT01 TaxID=756698 RepID=UPI00079A50C1|nr:hypothetical protein [Moritella sp. JT01]KXO09211.1 hypothetical protein AKG98_1427 [Moritella sp. JT01]